MSEDKKIRVTKTRVVPPGTVTRGRTPIPVVAVVPRGRGKESAGITPIPARVVPTNKKKD